MCRDSAQIFLVFALEGAYGIKLEGGTTSLVWSKPALLAYICKSDRPGLSILHNILALGHGLGGGGGGGGGAKKERGLI